MDMHDGRCIPRNGRSDEAWIREILETQISLPAVMRGAITDE